MDSLCHPCITTNHLSYSCPSLKLPPPPCTVLLGTMSITTLRGIKPRKSAEWDLLRVASYVQNKNQSWLLLIPIYHGKSYSQMASYATFTNGFFRGESTGVTNDTEITRWSAVRLKSTMSTTHMAGEPGWCASWTSSFDDSAGSIEPTGCDVRRCWYLRMWMATAMTARPSKLN